jgi:hypothetical protein
MRERLREVAWLRLDDGFASHPKIAALTDRELRIWLRILCWCSRHGDPTVDGIAINEVRGLSARTVQRYVDLELLDQEGAAHVVHDWTHYQPKDPTGAERQAKWRASRYDAVTPPVTDSLPRARAHARSRPVPREVGKPTSRKPDEIWDALTVELRTSPSTKSERGRWNRAVGELREAGATPDDIKRRVREYRRLWPDMSLTVSALAANWGLLKPRSAAFAICSQCGTGGGQHTEDCSLVTKFTEAEVQNLAARMAENR